MKQTKPTPEQRRRMSLTLDRLHRSADTAAEVLAGKYAEDTAGYLLDCIDTVRSELLELPASARARAA